MTTTTRGVTGRATSTRRHAWLAVPTTLALALAGCGGGQDGGAAPTEDTVATSAPDPVAGTQAPSETQSATSTPDAAPATGAPATSDEPEPVEEPEPTDAAAPPAPTGTPVAEAPAYPTESAAYAQEFVAAWSSLDDARVAELAVEEVTHGTDSWGVWSDLVVLESCELDPLTQLHEVNAGLAGLDLVEMQNGENWLSVVVRRDSLGGARAVVGVDLVVSRPSVAGLARAETPLDAYARSFVEAWVDEDVERMERLSSPEITELKLRDRPALDSPEPHWFGFAALEGDPVEFYVFLPHPEEVSQVSDVVWVDPARALAGEPHAVVGTNVHVDPRYMANCQTARWLVEGYDG